MNDESYMTINDGATQGGRRSPAAMVRSISTAPKQAWCDASSSPVSITAVGWQSPSCSQKHLLHSTECSIAGSEVNTPLSQAASVSSLLGLGTSSSPFQNSAQSPPLKRATSEYLRAATFMASAASFSITLKHLAVGDNLDVVDKWTPRHGHLATHASGSVLPLPDDSSFPEACSGCSSLTVTASRRSGFQTLLWYYLQTFLYSFVVAAPVYPLVYILSLVPWHLDNPVPDAQPVFLPNTVAIQWAVFMQCVLSLGMYAIVLYWSTMRTFRVPRLLGVATTSVIAFAAVVVAIFYHFKVAIWFYYLDLMLIAAVYIPAMCAVGWLAAGVNATLQDRVNEVLFVALLETLVAVATLIYTTFMMPLFFTFTSAWLQMLWLCIIHPCYFEVATSAIVRKALHRNVRLGRTDVVHFLPIVHAMVHVVALNITLQASIEPVHIIAVSALLYNVGKLVWRSTVLYRDLLVERVIRLDWSFNYDQEERLQLGHLICVSVLTELILENAAVVTAPFMMWCMYEEPIFMSTVPNTFFANKGTYPFTNMIAMLGIMFAFTWIGDLAFFALNYHMGQRLPLIYSWRKIKEGAGAYLGFLTYAMATMGVMFSFSMMLILPRAVYCKSDNYCTCNLVPYQAVCEGKYISTLVDYLVG